MHTFITENHFIRAFENYNVHDRYSYEGIKLLYAYLDRLYPLCSKELDVIEICIEYPQDKIENVLKYYDLENLEQLKKRTLVLTVDQETIIYKPY